jgi:hypothetical protein
MRPRAFLFFACCIRSGALQCASGVAATIDGGLKDRGYKGWCRFRARFNPVMSDHTPTNSNTLSLWL